MPHFGGTLPRASVTGKPFNWSGQNGRLNWLLGSNGGANYHVWNPSNFSVNYATSAGSASTANTATNATNASSLSGVAAGSYARRDVASYFDNGTINTDDSSGPSLQAYSSGGRGAIMSFHRGGSCAVSMGLASDNVFRIGGWRAGANRLQLDMNGNLTFPGDMHASQFNVFGAGLTGAASSLTAGEANSVAWGNVTGRPAMFGVGLATYAPSICATGAVWGTNDHGATVVGFFTHGGIRNLSVGSRICDYCSGYRFYYRLFDGVSCSECASFPAGGGGNCGP